MPEKISEVIIDLARLPENIGYHDAAGRTDISITEYTNVIELIEEKINIALEVAPPRVLVKNWCPIGLAAIMGAVLGSYYLEGRIKSFDIRVTSRQIQIPICGPDGFICTEKDLDNYFSCEVQKSEEQNLGA